LTARIAARVVLPRINDDDDPIIRQRIAGRSVRAIAKMRNVDVREVHEGDRSLGRLHVRRQGSATAWPRSGDVLHGGVDRDPRQVLGAQGAGVMRDPQGLGQQQPELGAEPAAPLAQI
jgi:hypothetical protein